MSEQSGDHARKPTDRKPLQERIRYWFTTVTQYLRPVSTVWLKVKGKIKDWFLKIPPKWRPIATCCLIIACLLLFFLFLDFGTSLRIVSISPTKGLDARGGEIRITYNHRPRYQIYKPQKQTELPFEVKRHLDPKDTSHRTEIYKLIKPTRYNATYYLERDETVRHSKLFGLFKPRKIIKVTTKKEEIKIAGLVPRADSHPTPDVLENQIGIDFQGEVRGKYKTGTNILVSEMEYVKMTPEVPGYYRWVNDSLLTFNFTEIPPAYDKLYSFEVFPEKFINTDYQKWVGETREISMRTGKNEVYVTHFSLKGDKVRWNQTLQIEFSGHMVGALDVLKKRTQQEVPIKITPHAGGTWTWVNSKTIEFTPDDKLGWPVRRAIEVKVFPAINVESGRKWRHGTFPEVFTFTVLPRDQSMTSYNLRGLSVELDEDLVVTFSRDIIDETSLRRKIQPTETGFVAPLLITPSVKGYFYWVERDRVKFHPENLWSELTKYTVELNPRFNPDPRYEWKGTRVFSFKTVENVVIPHFFFTPEEQISPSSFFSNQDQYRHRSNQSVKPEYRLWITFDKRIGHLLDPHVDLSTVVQIEPKIKGKFHWLGPSLLEFTPADNWRENTTYKVILTKRLLTHPQQHFQKGTASITFTTSENLVVVTFPPAGRERIPEIDPSAQLIFDFSKNMKTLPEVGRLVELRELVAEEAPFVVQPSVPLKVIWDTKRHLVIRPIEYWAPETEYEIILSKKLLPQSEAEYSQNPTYRFKTRKNIVRIDSFTPQGHVGRRIVIDVHLSKQIKPKSIPIGSEEPSQLLTIKPKLAGKWIWLAADKLQFKPTTALDPSTEYHVTFNPNLIADKQFTWHVAPPKDTERYNTVDYRFFTPALHVVSTDARFVFNQENLLKQKFYLDITLSDAVREEDLRKHFSIWYEKLADGKHRVEVPLLYTLEVLGEKGAEGIREFSVVSKWIDRPANNRQIHYQIREGLKPIVGNLNLQSDYRNYFLQEKIKYLEIKDVMWQREGNRFHAILKLSAPVDPEQLHPMLAVRHVTGEKIDPKRDKTISYELSVSSVHSREYVFAYEVRGEFKPGENYFFEIAEGLLATDGAFSRTEITYSPPSVPHLPNKLAFGLDGSFLSQQDLTKIPIESVNLDEFWLKIEQIYPNNVHYFINNQLDAPNISDVAKEVHHEKYLVRTIPGKGQSITGLSDIGDQVIVTHVDLSHLLRKNIHGLLRVTIASSEHSYSTKSDTCRWFLATDIGLISRKFGDNVIVWANSLKTTKELAWVEIKVIDRWNQVIGRAVTNPQGVASIPITPGSTPTHLVATQGNDFSFLDMQKHQQRLTAFDIEGVYSDKATIRSFIYSDRGVYRPGETIHVVAVTRGKEGILPPSYPVVFKLTNPTGKVILTERYRLDENGLYVNDFQIPAEAKTGKWTATVTWDGKAVGSYTFQVEEFIPAKIKVVIKQEETKIRPGETLHLAVQSSHLFGPPTVGRPVHGKIYLRANYFKPKGYERFRFGHDDVKFQRIDHDFPESKLDDEGKHEFAYTIPDDIVSPIGISAHYSATVIDDGGRAVTKYGSTDVLLYSQYVGIRRTTEEPIKTNQSIGFEVVNVDADGNPIPPQQQKLIFRIFHIKQVTHYRKNERGYYRYVTEQERVLIETLDQPLDSHGKFFYTIDTGGEYLLEVEDVVGKQVTRYPFQVYSDKPTEQFVAAADRVEIKVLNRKVTVHSTIDVELRTPFDGRVLVTLEREKVLTSRVIQTSGRKAQFSVSVPQTYLPNFYISAIALQPVSKGSRAKPIFAIGVINVDVVDPSHSPEITMSVPKRVAPNSKLTVDLHVSDTNKDDMYYTIAAVDEGILALTDYKLPDMTGAFNEKRRLEVLHHHLYSMIMPYEPDVKYEISPSGGAPSRALIKKKRVSPESQVRVKSVALWSGLLKTDRSGRASVTFDVPDFNGTLRIMAVAFGKQRFASTEKKIIVRDRLVLKPILPRFIATGDDFILPVVVFNGTEVDGTFTVKLIASDHVSITGKAAHVLPIKRNGEAHAEFAIQAKSLLGVSRFEIVSEGNGEITRKIINVPVRSPGTLVTKSGSGVVDERTPKTVTIPTGFKPGSEQMAMKISARPLVQYENVLKYLLRYPHGCLEQTTSKLFPLIYFEDLAKAAAVEEFAEDAPRYFIRKGINKIERMQLEDGSFAFWEGRSLRNFWAHIYASHFLVEAKRAGFAVDEGTWNNMVYRLGNILSAGPGDLDESEVSYQIYAAQVLALANEPVRPRLNYFYENQFDLLKPHDKARLAIAFAASGDKETARSIVQRLSDFDSYEHPYRRTGGSFSSHIRDLAVILDAYTEVIPDSEHIVDLIKRLGSLARNGRWGTTQENAAAFLAIGRALAKSPAAKIATEVRLSLGDGSNVPFNNELLLKTPELLKGDVRIEVVGEGKVSYAWEVVGIEKDPKSLQVDEGLRIRRRFLDQKGGVLDLKKIRQGDLVVVEIKMKARDKMLHNVIITDLLPTGLEVENPRLATSARMEWLRSDIIPDYVDIRDDRINIYLSVPTREQTYYYTARAVTVGSFKIPHIHGEAMYDPEIYSYADDGQMRIVPPAHD